MNDSHSDQVLAAAALFGLCRAELGFIPKAALRTAERRQELWLRADRSAAYLWCRRDGQATLHALAVHPNYRRQGEASALLQEIRTAAVGRGMRCLLARCPVDLPANGLYAARGFVLQAVEPGKHRPLNVWVATLS